MKNGGTVDLRHARRADRAARRAGDAGGPLAAHAAGAASTCPSWSRCRAIMCVTKTFYLIDRFVGRTDDRPDLDRGAAAARPRTIASSARRAPATASRRSSSPPNDLAARLGGRRRRPAALPADSRRRAPARTGLRGGVNLVMYTLTGNYKADQVHAQGSSGKAIALSVWSIAFSPLLPLAGADRACRARRWPSRSRCAGAAVRGAWLRALALALLLLGALDPVAVPRGPPAAQGCRRGGGRPFGKPGHRRAAAADGGGARRAREEARRARQRRNSVSSRPRASESDDRGHASCSRRCTARSPTRRPSGSAARSWSPTAIVARHSRSPRPRWASTRRCMR